nr:hypothetical protein [Tanacetum cinerariifolium]
MCRRNTLGMQKLTQRLRSLFNTLGSRSFRDYMNKMRIKEGELLDNLISACTLPDQSRSLSTKGDWVYHVTYKIVASTQKELGRDPTAAELFFQTHVKKDRKTFVDSEAKETWEKYIETYEAEETLDKKSGNIANTYIRWADHVGSKKGKFYGLPSGFDRYIFEHIVDSISQTSQKHEMERMKTTQKAHTEKLDQVAKSQSSLEADLKLIQGKAVAKFGVEFLHQVLEQEEYSTGHIEISAFLRWPPKVTLGRLLPHTKGLGFKPRRGDFPSGAKKKWGLSPKAKVRVLHTAQLDVTMQMILEAYRLSVNKRSGLAGYSIVGVDGTNILEDNLLDKAKNSVCGGGTSLSTLHFLKIPKNSFEVLKISKNSLEVLKVLENKLESMKLQKNCYIPSNNEQNEPTQGDIGETSNEPTQAIRNEFKELYARANEELYPGVFPKCIPTSKGYKLSPSFYAIKKTFIMIGLGYESIHACVNNCFLFRGEDNKDVHFCPVCNTSRWKDINTQGEKVPKKELRYFLIIPRLQHLYKSSHTTKEMTWHATEKCTEPGLAAGGFNPFGNLSQSYNMWPMILTTYNLPLWLCMKENSFMLMLLIPGPKSPGKDIFVYLRPLINDLKDIWALKDVARGHDVDGGGNDRSPPHQIGGGCRGHLKTQPRRQESRHVEYPQEDQEPRVKEDHGSIWPTCDPASDLDVPRTSQCQIGMCGLSFDLIPRTLPDGRAPPLERGDDVAIGPRHLYQRSDHGHCSPGQAARAHSCGSGAGGYDEDAGEDEDEDDEDS